MHQTYGRRTAKPHKLCTVCFEITSRSIWLLLFIISAEMIESTNCDWRREILEFYQWDMLWVSEKTTFLNLYDTYKWFDFFTNVGNYDIRQHHSMFATKDASCKIWSINNFLSRDQRVVNLLPVRFACHCQEIGRITDVIGNCGVIVQVLAHIIALL